MGILSTQVIPKSNQVINELRNCEYSQEPLSILPQAPNQKEGPTSTVGTKGNLLPPVKLNYSQSRENRALQSAQRTSCCIIHIPIT